MSDVLYLFSPAVDLLGLLKWRSNTSLLQQNLRHLMKVEGGEVVKVCIETETSSPLQMRAFEVCAETLIYEVTL